MKAFSLTMATLLANNALAATTVTFVNKCANDVILNNDMPLVTIKSGGQFSEGYTAKPDGGGKQYRIFNNPSGTLAEFSEIDMGIFYDISIIPSSSISGPGWCTSYDDCMRVTHASGFNVPMEIVPQSNLGVGSCRVLSCLQDRCSDAYQYPQDDQKTHHCPPGTLFTVTLCPNGGYAGIIPVDGGVAVYPNDASTLAPVTLSPVAPVTTQPAPPTVTPPASMQPPTSAPVTPSPPTQAPPTEIPPTQTPPTQTPPTQAPPTQTPPTQTPPTPAPSHGMLRTGKPDSRCNLPQ